MTPAAKFCSIVASVVLFGALMEWHGRHAAATSARYEAAVDTVRLTETRRQLVTDTLRIALRAKARTDTLVQVLTDTQVVVRTAPAAPPETLTVVAPIAARIRACDLVVGSCRAALAADSNEIRALRHLVATPKPERHWGIGATFGYGCNVRGCGPGVTGGISWRW